MSKKVLVTGGCGFIGRRLALEMLEGGYEVRALDSLVEQVHGSPQALPSGDVEYLIGDVRDPDLVAKALQGVDFVAHLAAEVGVGQSMYEIARYVGGNDLGTAVLLEGLIANPVERVVVASSMSVYGEGLYRDRSGRLVAGARRSREDLAARHWDPSGDDGAALEPVPTGESKPVDLASIYALTKYAQERAVMIYGEAYGVDTVALRLFNVFGPGQALSNPYTGVLANFASRLAVRERPLVFEDGNQKRDFVHVADVARAFRLALERPQSAGNVINVGSGHAYSIASVATMLAEAMDVSDIEPEILGKARSGDIRNCFADIGLARQLLGFEPRHRLEDSLEELAEWVAGVSSTDNAHRMRKELEARGLVA